MPRLRKPASPYDNLMILINGYLANQGKHLEDVIGCSYGTAKRRKDSPEDITLGELRMIMRALGIPVEDVRAALPY